jgi:hypothetical protein
MSYLKNKEILAQVRGSAPLSKPFAEEQFDDFVLEKGAKLKKNDLLSYQYYEPIKQYMIERKGVDYKDKPKEQVVEDFVDHMRFFNANMVSTAGEARFVNKATDAQKAKAKKAYQIYDALGNVFVNDGIGGAFNGVGDYIKAIASDPSTYVGLLTGGAAKVGAVGASLGGKQAIKAAVRMAGREALQSGATREAAKLAGEKAGIEAARRAVAKGYKTRQAGKLYQEVAKRVESEGKRGLARQAMRKKQAQLISEATRKSLYYTTGIDAALAAQQDMQIQGVLMDVGAQEKYSVVQTSLALGLGGIAGAVQLGAGKARGASGFADEGDPLEGISNLILEENLPKLDQSTTKSAVDSTIDSIKSWKDKVKDGKAHDPNTLPEKLMREIVLGKDGKGGIVQAFKAAGYTFKSTDKISDVMTNFVRYLDDDQLKQINDVLEASTGVTLGEVGEQAIKLGDLLAFNASDAGSKLQIQSQFKKMVNANLTAANERIANQLDDDIAKEAIEAELESAKKAEPLKYGQSVWKRLLVSSPATTAMNVAGFTQFYAGQTVADLFNATRLVVKGLGQGTIGYKSGMQESMRQARALTALQGQKIRNLLDPHTTHDAYMKFLSQNPELEKVLFESMTGGIERTSKRFNIDPESKFFNKVEAFTTAANQITGVRIQDSWTKSQMFMTEMDKYLRVYKDTTLREVLNSGRHEIIDDVVIGGALDTTMKSVFAKDYTTSQQPELLRAAAKFTEQISNTPGLGTILPFGRFFNNVLATAYQWSPLAAPEALAKFTARTFKREGVELTDMDATARMVVGSTALYLAMEADEPRREKGLAYYEVDGGDGTIIDARNTFPYSLFLAVGRAANLKRQGEDVPNELIQDMTAQLAVGQLARDAQFANDLYNVFDVLLNPSEGSREASAQAFAKVAGNFAAGFTRPLDAVNKVAGFAMGTDTAKDIRQAEGGVATFTQSATKYVDNIFEAFIDKTDTLTGEELRVATREGEVYDANPFARIFGVTIKPGRTATEKVYSMSEMHPWTANERTKMAAYDGVFNGLLAPILEEETQKLLDSQQFQDAPLAGKREMLKRRLADARKQVRERMDGGYEGAEPLRMRTYNRVSRSGNKELRRMAADMLKRDYGITGDPRDFELAELDLWDDMIKLLKEVYEDVDY